MKIAVIIGLFIFAILLICWIILSANYREKKERERIEAEEKAKDKAAAETYKKEKNNVEKIINTISPDNAVSILQDLAERSRARNNKRD